MEKKWHLLFAQGNQCTKCHYTFIVAERGEGSEKQESLWEITRVEGQLILRCIFLPERALEKTLYHLLSAGQGALEGTLPLLGLWKEHPRGRFATSVH